MVRSPFHTIRHFIRSLGPTPASAESDGQLLEQFALRRDEIAFETLVRRHGGMVLAVCRRLLLDRHEAEDAFQSTFLVLARKAASIRSPEAVGSWLHAVAHRIAVRADQSGRLRRRQQPLGEHPGCDPDRNDADWRELRSALDEELLRLPEKYRAPVVLCYLENKTNAEAAQALGWPKGTVQGRLARARELLQRRLRRRGVAPSAGLAAVLAARTASTALTPALVGNAVQTARSFVTGTAAVAQATAQAAALAEGVLSEMYYRKLKIVASLLLTLAAFGAGGGTALLHWSALAVAPAPAADAPRPGSADKKPLKMQLGGNPLDGAVLDFAVDGKTLRCSIASWKKDVAFFPDLWETRFWDAASGKEWKTPQGDFREAVSPNGKWGFSKDAGANRLVDRATGKEISQVLLPDGFHVNGPSLFSPDGKSLILRISDAKKEPPPSILPAHDYLARFETATGKLIHKYGPGLDVVPSAFSPDGNTLYANQLAFPDGGFLFFALDVDHDKATGLGHYFIPRNRPSPDGKLLGLDGRLSPDGKTFVILGAVEQDRDSVLHLFDTVSGKKRGEIKGHFASVEVLQKDPPFAYETIKRSGILCFAFAPDGKTLVTGGEDGAVCVWDAVEAKTNYQYTGHQDGKSKVAVLSVVFTPDGREVASVDDKGNMYVWEVQR